jgi:high-affinity iron transporter
MRPIRSAHGSKTTPAPESRRARARFARVRLTVIMRRLAAMWFVLACAGVSVAADVASMQRLLGIVAAVGQEYAEAFDERGTLVRPLELDEARLLLADARAGAAKLATDGAPDVELRLATLEAKLAARAPASAVSDDVRALRETIERATGVHEDIFPRVPPSPVRGQAVYRAYCASCHGEHGAGDGPDARGLAHKPADFTDASFMRGEMPADFFRVVSLGRRRSAMPAWEDSLSIRDRWDVIGYVWTLGTTPRALAEGQELFTAHCASCHGTAGDGRGGEAPAPDLRSLARIAERTDADLHDVITAGVVGKMPAFADALRDEQRWSVVALVRALSLGLPAAPGLESARTADFAGALGEVRRRIDAALEAYRLGDGGASDVAADAYLLFEPLEPDIARREPTAVLRAEREFLRLRTALRQAGDMRQVDDAAAAVKRALDGAEQVQRAATSARGDIALWAGGAIAALVLALLYGRRRVSP